MQIRRFFSTAAALALGVSVLTGCHTNRLESERNALWSQNQELQDELNRSRAALDAAMAEQAARDAEAARRAAQQQQPAPVVQSGPEAFRGIEGVEAQMRGQDIQVTVASDILFAPGRAELSTAARRSLSQVAGVLKNQHAGNRIVVEGHTDTDPIKKSKWSSNQELSEARAQAVVDHLAQQGISRGDMRTVGYGSTQPKETKAKSRRVEIVVVQ